MIKFKATADMWFHPHPADAKHWTVVVLEATARCETSTGITPLTGVSVARIAAGRKRWPAFDAAFRKAQAEMAERKATRIARSKDPQWRLAERARVAAARLTPRRQWDNILKNQRIEDRQAKHKAALKARALAHSIRDLL